VKATSAATSNPANDLFMVITLLNTGLPVLASRNTWITVASAEAETLWGRTTFLVSPGSSAGPPRSFPYACPSIRGSGRLPRLTSQSSNPRPVRSST
jgi:hypothetical protein